MILAGIVCVGAGLGMILNKNDLFPKRLGVIILIFGIVLLITI